MWTYTPKPCSLSPQACLWVGFSVVAILSSLDHKGSSRQMWWCAYCSTLVYLLQKHITWLHLGCGLSLLLKVFRMKPYMPEGLMASPNNPSSPFPTQLRPSYPCLCQKIRLQLPALSGNQTGCSRQMCPICLPLGNSLVWHATCCNIYIYIYVCVCLCNLWQILWKQTGRYPNSASSPVFHHQSRPWKASFWCCRNLDEQHAGQKKAAHLLLPPSHSVSRSPSKCILVFCLEQVFSHSFPLWKRSCVFSLSIYALLWTTFTQNCPWSLR